MTEAGFDPVTTTPVVKPKQKRINYALGAVLVSKGFSLDEAAKQAGAKNGTTLRVGLRRKGITPTASRALLPSMPERVTVTARIVSDATQAIRDRTNNLLSMQVDKLGAKKPGRLANRGQGEAAVLETLSRTWRNLNGSPDQISIQFGASMVSDMVPPQVTVEVPSVTVPDSTPPVDSNQ